MILYDELIQTNTCKIDGIIIKQTYKTNYRKFEDTYIKQFHQLYMLESIKTFSIILYDELIKIIM